MRRSDIGPTLSVKQMRSNARAALASQRMARQQISQATRRMLQESRAAIIGSVRAAFGRGAAHDAANPSADSRTAKAPKSHGGVWDLQSNETSAPNQTKRRDAQLQSRVLRIIEDHPEGIRTVDVGNELGVDWRRVLGITHCLVEEGLVDQVDQDLYPAGKESRRW